jgi:hypothetical protein
MYIRYFKQTNKRSITCQYHLNNWSGFVLKVMCLCTGFWRPMRRSATMLNPQENNRHLIETLRLMPTEETWTTNIFPLTAFFDVHRCLLLDFILYDNTVIAKCSSRVIQNVCTKVKKRQAANLTDGINVLHDNVLPHVAHRVQDQLNVMQWEVLRHPAYSMDLSVAIFTFCGP